MWCPQTPSYGCNVKRSFCAFCLAAICGTSDSLTGQQAFSFARVSSWCFVPCKAHFATVVYTTTNCKGG
ncbi:hypothetical protein BDL97_04G062200 [Sphagnum fallax]|nr:hypothetical protein BDL97_04G062200 [Sphagnum fallax]